MASSTFIKASSNIQVTKHPSYVCQHFGSETFKPYLELDSIGDTFHSPSRFHGF